MYKYTSYSTYSDRCKIQAVITTCTVLKSKSYKSVILLWTKMFEKLLIASFKSKMSQFFCFSGITTTN